MIDGYFVWPSHAIMLKIQLWFCMSIMKAGVDESQKLAWVHRLRTAMNDRFLSYFLSNWFAWAVGLVHLLYVLGHSVLFLMGVLGN
jgi:hypothetical protein